ncbi:L-rhamnose mutarotase [Halorubrum lacusprofundi]|jgi:L-rhamnose mutarotase|uniref:L-rhamnose mutarotase n=1 Tax=Halorubrum lacusprofundi TaxID=2247 RepID=UPI000B5A41AD|nr:L-rhamnose mutarotase [Halorubrum lacusprofundi]MCG1007560.1 L-rhamnose mutarotase [Halorubrum lacusprofundi]
MADNERAVYVQRLAPDQREAYVEAHDDVPEGVTDAMERGGVKKFELYVREDIAVCILECADIEAYLEAVDGDEAVDDWERYTGRFKQSGVDADADPKDGIPFMERVWRFEPDAE